MKKIFTSLVAIVLATMLSSAVLADEIDDLIKEGDRSDNTVSSVEEHHTTHRSNISSGKFFDHSAIALAYWKSSDGEGPAVMAHVGAFKAEVMGQNGKGDTLFNVSAELCHEARYCLGAGYGQPLGGHLFGGMMPMSSEKSGFLNPAIRLEKGASKLNLEASLPFAQGSDAKERRVLSADVSHAITIDAIGITVVPAVKYWYPYDINHGVVGLGLEIRKDQWFVSGVGSTFTRAEFSFGRHF